MQTADPMVKRFMTRNRKRKPPKDEGPPVRAIPGLGSFVGPYNVGHRPSFDGTKAQHNWAGPRDRAPYGGKRRRPRIRKRNFPNPGRKPTLN